MSFTKKKGSPFNNKAIAMAIALCFVFAIASGETTNRKPKDTNALADELSADGMKILALPSDGQGENGIIDAELASDVREGVYDPRGTQLVQKLISDDLIRKMKQVSHTDTVKQAAAKAASAVEEMKDAELGDDPDTLSDEADILVDDIAHLKDDINDELQAALQDEPKRHSQDAVLEGQLLLEEIEANRATKKEELAEDLAGLRTKKPKIVCNNSSSELAHEMETQKPSPMPMDAQRIPSARELADEIEAQRPSPMPMELHRIPSAQEAHHHHKADTMRQKSSHVKQGHIPPQARVARVPKAYELQVMAACLVLLAVCLCISCSKTQDRHQLQSMYEEIQGDNPSKPPKLPDAYVFHCESGGIEDPTLAMTNIRAYVLSRNSSQV